MTRYYQTLVSSELVDAERRITHLWNDNLECVVVEMALDNAANGGALSSYSFAMVIAIVSPAMMRVATARFVAVDCREIICTGVCGHMVVFFVMTLLSPTLFVLKPFFGKAAMTRYYQTLVSSELVAAEQRITHLWNDNLECVVVEMALDNVANGGALSSYSFAMVIAIVSSAMMRVATARFVSVDCREIIWTGVCGHTAVFFVMTLLSPTLFLLKPFFGKAAMTRYYQTLVSSELVVAEWRITHLWNDNLECVVVEMALVNAANGIALSSYSFAMVVAIVSPAMVRVATARFVAVDCREII